MVCCFLRYILVTRLIQIPQLTANLTSTQPRRLFIPLAMIMVMVALALARLAYGLLVPSMRFDLSLSVQQAGLLGTATSLGYLLFVLPAGIVTRRYGSRRIILSGFLCVLLGFTGLAIAGALYWLVLWMALLGIGTAFIYTPVITFIVGWYPDRRGLVLGLVNSGIGLGVFVSGILVPWLISIGGQDSWRSVWALFALITAVVWVAAMAIVRDPKISETSVNPVSPQKESLFASSTVYKHPAIRLLAACYFILGFTYIVQAVFMYSYAIESGVSAAVAGRLSSVAGFLSILAGFGWGVISDRIGRANTLMICFYSSSVATFIPVLMPTVIGFTIHYLLAGSMVSGLFATILAATSESVLPQEVPIAIGFVTVFFAFGQLMGPLVAGLIIDHIGSFGSGFVLSAGTMLLGGLLAFKISLMHRSVVK